MDKPLGQTLRALSRQLLEGSEDRGAPDTGGALIAHWKNVTREVARRNGEMFVGERLKVICQQRGFFESFGGSTDSFSGFGEAPE
jgi:hypothetical protein